MKKTIMLCDICNRQAVTEAKVIVGGIRNDFAPPYIYICSDCMNAIQEAIDNRAKTRVNPVMTIVQQRKELQ